MAKPSWVTLSKSSGTGGGSVNVTCKANTGTSRSGSITVKTASGLTKSVSVSQEKRLQASTTCTLGAVGYQGHQIYVDFQLESSDHLSNYLFFTNTLDIYNALQSSTQHGTIDNVPVTVNRFVIGIDAMDFDGSNTQFTINSLTFTVDGSSKTVQGIGSSKFYPIMDNGGTNYVYLTFSPFTVTDGMELEVKSMVIQVYYN